ncbi:MAG: hypothetical protein LVQ95_01050 [Candidatus Micrarchaeales archaeon]|nr:hypothetical protein [Candidatus Micrarchaeales archaeon]
MIKSIIAAIIVIIVIALAAFLLLQSAKSTSNSNYLNKLLNNASAVNNPLLPQESQLANITNNQSIFLPPNYHIRDNLSGSVILLYLSTLGQLYQLFGNSSTEQSTESNGVGVVEEEPQAQGGSIELSSNLPSRIEDNFSTIPLGWLALGINVYSSKMQALIAGNPVQIRSQSKQAVTLTPDQFFFALAFDQYAGYYISESEGMTGITPYISMITYFNDSLVVNGGNIDPAVAGNAVIYLDGKQAAYKRYYNFYVINGALAIGMHNVTLKLGNQTLAAKFYVNPNLEVNDFYVVSRSAAHFSVKDVNYRSITISNLTLYPIENSNLSYSSSTPITLIQNQGINISINSSSPCSIPETVALGLTFDTDYGKASYQLVGPCA